MQLPCHSYLLALLICPMILTAPILLPARRPQLRHSPSFSRASMALPLIMLTENTNARGKKLSCLFSSASSRLIDLVTGENKGNNFLRNSKKANKWERRRRRERKARKIKQKDRMK